MLKKGTLIVLNGLLLLSTFNMITCKLPVDPRENPNVVDAQIFLVEPKPPLSIISGEEATFGICVSYPMHIIDIAVSFDKNNDTTVSCKTKSDEQETLYVKNTYTEVGVKTISIGVKLTNGTIKPFSQQFSVSPKMNSVSFTIKPKPHIAVINEPDTLLFIAKTNSYENDIIFKSSSIPPLGENKLKLINSKDTAFIVVIPEEKKVYTIMCKAKYGAASDSTNVAVTAYEKPLLTASSGSEAQIVGIADTLLLTLPSNSSEFQFTLLDSSSYNPGVLYRLKNAPDKITFLFKPNEIKTYSFSFLVKKDDLKDTITYQRMVIEKPKPVWNKASENVAAVEGNEITFPFASCLTDPLKEILFTASKGTMTGYLLKYLVPWECASTDTVTIDANYNGVISSFKLFLNIAPGDSIAPKIIRIKPESDTINTDKLTCEFKISDLGAGVGVVKFERESKVITDTVHTDGLYKCTIGGLKHGDTIKIKVTATDKSMRKNSDSMIRTIVVIKSDTAKSFTSFGFCNPSAKGVINNSTKQILVTVPFGTDVRSLTAVFTTTGASVQVDSKEQTSNTTVNDFTNPIKYTVIAVDKSTTDYEVTVVVASPGKNADLSGLTVSEGTLTPAFSANIVNYSVNIANSVESLTVTGTMADSNAKINYVPSQNVKLSVGESIITVNVTAQDNTIKKKYEIKVLRAASSSKEITSFGFVSPAASVKINANDTDIYITVPYGTKVNELIATFETTGATVNIGSVKQESGKTVNDFAKLVTYTIFADDGSKQNYNVIVIIAKNSAKEMAAFGFESLKIKGKIDSSAKTVSVTVPYGTDVTSLVATFTVTGVLVRIGSITQRSGITTNNFKNSVTYTVVADDGNTEDYVVTVSIDLYEFTVTFDGQNATTGPDPKIIKVKEPATTVGELPKEPKKINCKFEGWFTGPNGIGELFTGSSNVRHNLTVYSNWVPVYKVLYHANNGTGDVPVDTSEYENGKTVQVLDENTLKRVNYKFVGWNTKPDTTGANFVAGNSFKMASANVNLYAKWRMNAPVINISPVSQTKEPLDSITFTVSATGPELYYQWQKDGENISGANYPTLRKTKIIFTDEGQYQCVVSNAGGSLTSDTAKLTINKTLTDVEGNVYNLVIIGTQVWTVENLRTTRFNDGTPIPQAEWESTSPRCCFYDNNTDPYYQKKWGALYNWYAVFTEKLAPYGWHVPTADEWNTLQNYLIANGYNHDNTNTGNKIGKALAAKTDWNRDSNTGAIGNDLNKNNKSGFSALPGGYCNTDFKNQNDYGYWWSASGEYNRVVLEYNSETMYGDIFDKTTGFSVRLLRD